MKDIQDIGKVALTYKEDGTVENVEFRADMSLKLDDPLLRQFGTLTPSSDVDALKSNADLAMAAWFSRMNDFELADREQWVIESRVIHCDKYPSGSVKKCELEYTFKKRTA